MSSSSTIRNRNEDSSSEMNPTSKKQKQTNPDFKSVLFECGISSLIKPPSSLSSSPSTSNENKKYGCILEPNVNSSSLRASIEGLLNEMHCNGNDIDNTLVLDSMETFIMNGEYCSGEIDHDGNGNNNGGGKKYELLWKMLLPLAYVEETTSKNDDGIVANDKNVGTIVMTTSSSSSSSSLIKVLLRVDALQSTLITCLFSKLQEIAIIEQEDEGDLLSTSSTSLDFFTMIHEIPRLILNHIRWMDHIVQPKVLTQAALECLTMLCSMSGAANYDNDDHDDANNNDQRKRHRQMNRRTNNGNQRQGQGRQLYNKENYDSICKSILLDLIATLPDIIDEDISSSSDYKTNNDLEDEDNDDNSEGDDEEEEEDTMTMILSTLRDVRVQDPTLLIPCLDAVSSLRLTTHEQIESVIHDALEAIESVEESWLLPALCKFLMQNVPRGSNSGFGGGGQTNAELIQKVIESFRRLRLGQDHIIENSRDKDEREYRNQIQCNSDSEALMIEALSQGFAYRSDLTNALFQSIKNCTASTSANKDERQDHGPCDVWLLLCCAQTPHHKSKVKSIFKSKAVSAAFTADLIKDAIRGNGIALQSLFQSSMLFISDALIRSNENLAQNIGAVLYEEMFMEFDNRMSRQDLIGQLVIHINSGSYDEVDVAMKVLMNIASTGIEGITSLRIFLPFLTSLLDNVRNFHRQHLRRLFLLLFVVGLDGTCIDEGDNDMGTVGGGGGCDDVHIVIRKYLALPQITMKQIGIIGTVCFAASCPNTCNDPLLIKDIILMLDMVHKNCEEGKESWGHSRSVPSGEILGESAMSMFFDELCLALKGKSIAPFIKDWIQRQFASRLEELYLADLSTDDSEDASNKSDVELITDTFDKSLVKGTSNNPIAPIADLRYNFDKEDCSVYIKLLTLFVSEKSFERDLLPQQLCSLLRLLAACYDERYGGEGLSEIDALIGCPILLPDEESSGIDFLNLSRSKQWITTACIYTAVNWCRELINCFVHAAAFRTINSNETQMTQLQEENRSKVTQKLHALIELEEELQICSSKCYHFAPPGHSVLPVPTELRNMNNEMNIQETSDKEDEQDTTLLSKMNAEEKKVIAEIRKAKKKRAAARMKNKQKAIKLKAKHESELSKLCISTLIPFNIDVSLALGFPDLRIKTGSDMSSQKLMSSFGSSELRNLKVGGKLTNLLLRQLDKSLKSLFVSKSKQLPFSKRQSTDQSIVAESKDNPYNNGILKIHNDREEQVAYNTTMYQFLDACITQEVFISVHEHLAAIAEIRGNAHQATDSDDDILSCARLLLRCVTTLFDAEDLFNIPRGRAYLEMIIKQLSDGEQVPLIKQKPTSSISLLTKYVTNLFDLLEEIVIGGESDDITFVMEGVTCLKTVLQRISSAIKRLGEESIQIKSIQSMKLNISRLCKTLLQRNWNEKTSFNKGNVGVLLTMYLEYGSIPFKPFKQSVDGFEIKKFGRIEPVATILNAIVELSNTVGCKGPLESYPTCNHLTFGYYLSSILSILSKEITYLFQSPLAKSAYSELECLEVLHTLVKNFKQLSDLSKENPTFAKKNHLLMQMKEGSKFIDVFVKNAVPFLGNSFSKHEDFVIKIIRDTQLVTRQLSYISSHAKRIKDAILMKEAPKIKKSCEMFVYQMRSIMSKNGVLDALFSGNLKHRNIDGTFEEDPSQEEDDDNSQNEGDSQNRSDNSEGSDTESDDDESEDES